MTKLMVTIGLVSALLALGPTGIAAAQEQGPATKVTTGQDATGDQGQVPFPTKLPGKGTPAHTVASGTRSLHHSIVMPPTDTPGAAPDTRDAPPLSRSTMR
jgi:hypothetical protein